MANLFKALKPKADLGHSSFDLSQKHVFSSKSGMADVVCPIETVPNDHFKINIASLHRTMTMNTAAFLRGKFRYDTFFVPYSQLWHPFNQFVDQREDKHTTTQRDISYCPVFSIEDLLLLALHSYRHFHWDSSDTITSDCDIYGVPFIFGVVRMLDMLGYGNYQPILIPTESYNPATGQPWEGIERDDAFTAALLYAQQFNGKYCNLWRIAAYNHIWYDYYRNKYYDTEYGFDSLQNSIEYIYTFNFDDLDCDSFGTSILEIPSVTYSDPTTSYLTHDILRVFAIFTPKYVQWKKDLFTSSLPGTQFGVVSSVDFSGITSNSYGRYSSTSSTTQGNVIVNAGTTGLSLFAPNSLRLVHDHTFSSSFDVLALKRAEALQVWKQNTLRAGNMVDSNFMAHFGVKPRFEDDNNVVYLGSHEAILEVNAVTSQSDTGGSINGNVGDLAATGIASLKGREIEFDCNDFGVILTIASFLPESEYSNNMIDKANRLYEQFDYFTSEFQNVGLETINGVDLDANLFSNEENKVLGYAPRYWMYKTAIDKVHGEFADTPYMSPEGMHLVERISGSLRAWVSPRQESLLFSGQDADGYHLKTRTKQTFYCSPFVLDNIFALQNNGNYDNLGRQRTDCFLNNVYFDIKAIRPMSVLGLPQF